jgi:hypothetical protein
MLDHLTTAMLSGVAISFFTDTVYPAKMFSQPNVATETLVGPKECQDAKVFQQVAQRMRTSLPQTRIRNGEDVPARFVFVAVRRVGESLGRDDTDRKSPEITIAIHCTVFDESHSGASQKTFQ